MIGGAREHVHVVVGEEQDLEPPDERKAVAPGLARDADPVDFSLESKKRDPIKTVGVAADPAQTSVPPATAVHRPEPL